MAKDKNPTIFEQNSTSLLVIAAVAVTAFGIIATYKAVVDFGQYREVYQNEAEVLERYEANRENLEALEAEAADIESETGITTDLVLPLVPLGYHPAADLAALESVASGSPVQITGANMIDEADDADFSIEHEQDENEQNNTDSNRELSLVPYIAEITINGGYEPVKQFLDDVDTSARPLIVRDIELLLDGDELLVDLEIVLYHQGVDNGFDVEDDPTDDIDDDVDTVDDDVGPGGGI